MHDTELPFGPLIETTLRVVTWNVWGRHGPWERREPAIIAALRAAAPDVVVLPEAWETPADGQCGRLGSALGLDHHAYLPGSADSGLGVLSRWPILHHADQPLGSGAPGTVLFTELDGPRGPVQVFGVMLAWRLDHGLVRQGQVRDLATYVAKTQNRHGPVVVCGDFNAPPDSDEIRLLTGRAGPAAPGFVCYDAWEMAGGGGPGHTWSGDNVWAAPALWPSRRIDYVFSAWWRRGGAGHPVRCELVGTDPVDGVLGSDHYGVLAELRY